MAKYRERLTNKIEIGRPVLATRPGVDWCQWSCPWVTSALFPVASALPLSGRAVIWPGRWWWMFVWGALEVCRRPPWSKASSWRTDRGRSLRSRRRWCRPGPSPLWIVGSRRRRPVAGASRGYGWVTQQCWLILWLFSIGYFCHKLSVLLLMNFFKRTARVDLSKKYTKWAKSESAKIVYKGVLFADGLFI